MGVYTKTYNTKLSSPNPALYGLIKKSNKAPINP